MTNLQIPVEATLAPGETIVSAWANSNIRDAVDFLIGPPIAVLEQSATQTIGNVAITAMAFDGTSYVDSYGGHSSTVNNSRYVSQLAGYYAISANSGWATNATGNRLLMLFKNGAAITIAQVATPATSIVNSPGSSVVGIVQLGVGDYMEAYVYQNSGGNLGLSAQYDTLTLHFIHQ